MKPKLQRPATRAGCVYRWVKGWGWGLFPCKRPIPLWRKFKDGSREPLEGLWLGLTAPPPRIGPLAPRRWADQPVETPPFVLKRHQALASAVITDQLAPSNDPCTLDRLRDLKAHILERRAESGSLFQDTPWGAPPHSFEQARGIRWAELDGIELYRRSDQLRWFQDALANDITDNQRVAKRADPHTAIADNIPHGLDSEIAAMTGFEFEECDAAMVERILEKRCPTYEQEIEAARAGWVVQREDLSHLFRTGDYEKYLQGFEVPLPLLSSLLRERRKPRRKPIGEVAMTGAQRRIKHYYAHKPTLLPRERNAPGAVVPVPLGHAAPGISLTLEIEHMVSNFLEFELAEKYHQYLGEILDRLAAAPPSYMLSREEFTIVAAAGVLGRRLLKPAAEFH